jgi:hypothetical protein
MMGSGVIPIGMRWPVRIVVEMIATMSVASPPHTTTFQFLARSAGALP